MCSKLKVWAIYSLYLFLAYLRIYLLTCLSTESSSTFLCNVSHHEIPTAKAKWSTFLYRSFLQASSPSLGHNLWHARFLWNQYLPFLYEISHYMMKNVAETVLNMCSWGWFSSILCFFYIVFLCFTTNWKLEKVTEVIHKPVFKRMLEILIKKKKIG